MIPLPLSNPSLSNTPLKASVTVTVHSPNLLESARLVALITAVPGYFAVTVPSWPTTATSGVLSPYTDHITLLFAPAGSTTAVSRSFCPAVILVAVLLIETPVMSGNGFPAICTEEFCGSCSLTGQSIFAAS